MISFQDVISESYCTFDTEATLFPLFDSDLAISDETTISHMHARQSRTDFGTRLVQARKHVGMRQEDLADKAGISQSTLAAAERRALGSRYTPMLARALGVNPLWLADGTGPRYVADNVVGSVQPELELVAKVPVVSVEPSALALELAALFDELTTRRDRAVGYTRATQALLDVLAQRDELPTDTPVLPAVAKTPPV